MSESVEIILPDKITIAQADALHELLEPLLNDSKDVVLAAAKVERADTAGLQILLAFHQALSSRSLHLSWSSPSKPLLEAAEQLGMTHVLEFE